MARRFAYRRFSNEICPHKVSIEHAFYATLSMYMKSSALVISGPNYERHIENVTNYIATKPEEHKIMFVENDPDVFKEIINRAGGFKPKKNVEIVLGDVHDVEFNPRFQDLDLTATWDGDKRDIHSPADIFKRRLERQANDTFPSCWLKAFIFTVSERNNGGQIYTFQQINELLSILDAEIDGFDNMDKITIDERKRCFNRTFQLSNDTYTLHYKRAHVPNFVHQGRVKLMHICRYADGPPPMLTGLIVYR